VCKDAVRRLHADRIDSASLKYKIEPQAVRSHVCKGVHPGGLYRGFESRHPSPSRRSRPWALRNELSNCRQLEDCDTVRAKCL
jgi:hypothetical protein